MEQERIALLGSTFFYFLSCCSLLFVFKTKNFRPRHFQFVALVLGLLLQSWFLMLRGGLERSCPIGTLSETLIFLSWSIGLFYIVIGSTYRISLMGTFTAPFILVLQGVALLLPSGARVPAITPNPFVEAHAAVSLISFGAFGLACVSAMMFLVQERQLKSQHPSPIFHHLPPISLLEKVTARLLWVGLILLTISFAAGFLASLSISGMKVFTAFIFWVGVVALLLARQTHRLSARRFAAGAIMIFFLALILLLTQRSHKPPIATGIAYYQTSQPLNPSTPQLCSLP